MEEFKNYITQFKNWLKEDGERAREWKEGRKNREIWYKEKFNYNQIDNLTADDFSKLIKDLWASSIWSNKDYKVQYLIKNNGFKKIKKELREFLYSRDPIENRWDDFKKSIKGLGPSSISEILTFFDPQKYALINVKIYKVLPKLGIPIKVVKDGKSYKEAIETLQIIKNALTENGVKDVDFIITDFFIAYLFYEVFDLAYERQEIKPLREEKEEKMTMEENLEIKEPIFEKLTIDSHEKAEIILLSLGNLLGFDTYTPDKGRIIEGQTLGNIATLQELPYFGSEKIMESAQNIDIVWVKDEWPEFFFEVEHTTGITPGLLRIYRVAEKLSAKCFIISSAEMLPKFKKEIEKPPFDKLKRGYKFKSYKELEEMYLATKKFNGVSGRFFESQ